MRVEICFEDAIQYEWFLMKDSIQFPEEGVPLTWGYNWVREPLGMATDIRREDDGALTTELVFRKPQDEEDVNILLKNDDIEVSMWANEVSEKRCENLKIVHKASLKAVCLVITMPANPGAKVNL